MATSPVRRYALVPDPQEQPDGLTQPIRRFHLARVASRRWAGTATSGMEEIAERDEGPGVRSDG
jgi:hypothetical protein